MEKVLIVDDVMAIRLTLKLILIKNGFEIVGEAKDGENAIIKYQQLKPDIVTMDITMPQMDGITSIKAIRAVDNKAKIVVISAMGQLNMVRSAIAAGAKNFIVKPYTEDIVVKTIRTVLNEN